MTKKVIAGSLALLTVTAMYAQTYQLPNVGFENWENAKGIIHASSGNALSTSGKCPTSWFVPNIAYSADVSSLNATSSTANDVNLKNIQFGRGASSHYIPILGTLSLGQALYTSYGDGTKDWNVKPDNYLNPLYAQNGTFGGISFNGRPDAIYGDFKIDTRKNGESAHIISYLWNGTYFGEVPSSFDCDKTFDNTFGWTPVEIPLTYKSSATPEMTNVIIAAGYPWDSRKSVENNNICADNIRYVYYSRLSDASIDGYAFDFNPNTLDYVITVNDVENFALPTGVNYSIMSNEALTADKEATVSNINDNKQISIKVTNKQSIANAEATDADGLREHTYNFYFREAPQQFEGFYFTNVNGTDIYSGETTTLTLTQENADYHTYTLAIADVKVAQAATRAAGDAVNVTVSGLTKTEKDGKVIYSGTDDNAKVGNETKQVSAVATFDGDNYEVKFSFTNEDGTVTNVVSTPEPTTSSVSEINGATAAVAATEGAILVSNYNGAAAVYTTDGRLAANAEVNGSASINVAAGLYIVRTGNKATKVIVK